MKKGVLSIDYSFALKDLNRFGMGISHRDLKAGLALGAKKNKELFLERVSGSAGFYSLPYFEKETRKISRFAASLRRRFDTLVVLGIGGSALGTSAVMGALPERTRRKGGRVLVLDNVDPDAFEKAVATLDLKSTVFNVISKSGSTSETLSQFFVVTGLLKRKVGDRWKEHIIVTTDPEKGLLRNLAGKYGFLSFPVPPSVGGRFSVLSPVGLLPLAFAGVNVGSLLEGARYMDGINLGTEKEANPVVLLAAIYAHFMEDTRKNTFVLFAYSDFFVKLSDWFCQLWGESLGKEKKEGGRIDSIGQTPVGVIGVTAQHSQLQLYMEGPDDKVYTFIGPGKFRKDYSIKPLKKDESVLFLSGKKMADLFRAEMDATIYSLASKGRPVIVIEPHVRNEFAIGALIFLFECVTALTGKLLGVNPFDQPGVEYGKKLTRAMLGDKMSIKFLEDIEEFRKVRGRCEINLEAN